jgi:M6 family metalloprotease-like protein
MTLRKILVFSLLFVSIIFGGNVIVKGDTLEGVSQFNNVVIFIRFNDEQTYTAPYSLSHYEDMFNGVDVESLRDYYLEASYDQLTIDSYLVDDGTQIIYYTDTYDRAYFEPYSTENPDGYQEYQWDEREHELLGRAVDYVEDNDLIPDSLDLDKNDDGEIDSLTFMVSGEDSGWNTLLWPHKWQLHTFTNASGFTYDAPTINGKYAYVYTFELLGNSTSYDYQVDVGVLAHETFHLLGAPDLYHYYYYLNITPVGDWGIMDHTSDIPSHMLGYMKYAYGGWISDVTEITESGTYTLYPMQDDETNLYKIYTGYENEWLYVEYRDNGGFYESNLPESGLIVYRVNTLVEGNEYGSYYNDQPSDEVFIFRPFLDDHTEPIIIVDAEGFDGNIDDAALSQSNVLDSIGMGAGTPLFSSEGNILDILISNVSEHNGYITFDVSITPRIVLETNGVEIGSNAILYDSYLTEYTVDITNITSSQTAYYTLDGSTPTESSMVYDGTPIVIDGNHNIVNVAIYEGDILRTTLSETYTFSSTIETNHNPYDNNAAIVWYIDFRDTLNYEVVFDTLSEVENGYDYVYLRSDLDTEILTGNLGDLSYEYNNEYLIIVFSSDDSVNEYFGFELTINELEDVLIALVGNNSVTQTVYQPYVDLGYTLNGLNPDDYTVEVVSDIDVDTLGTYTYTYHVYDSVNTLITSVTRSVEVVDDIAPLVTLNGESEMYINVGETFVDPYITYSDNYDESVLVEVTGEVDTDYLGMHVLIYKVTDSSGNISVVTRTVYVVDHLAPEAVLNEGIDTIYEGDEWIDGLFSATDNLSTSFTYDVITELDTEVPGTYDVTYVVYDNSGNYTTLIRRVTVLEKPSETLEITCDPFLSTIVVGSELGPGNCYVGDMVMSKQYSELESAELGVHEIAYSFTYEGNTYSYTQYYIVIGDYSEGIVLYFEKRRDLI